LNALIIVVTKIDFHRINNKGGKIYTLGSYINLALTPPFKQQHKIVKFKIMEVTWEEPILKKTAVKNLIAMSLLTRNYISRDVILEWHF
jgi:hypothetical protein